MLIGDIGIDISQSLKYAGIKMWFFYLQLSFVLSFLFPLSQPSQPACQSLHTTNSRFCAFAWLIFCFGMPFSPWIYVHHCHYSLALNPSPARSLWSASPSPLCPSHVYIARMTGGITVLWYSLMLPILCPHLADLDTTDLTKWSSLV